MKRFLILLICALFASNALIAKKVENVDFVHPLCWYADMKNPRLQIIIHGDNISEMTTTLVNAYGISIVEEPKVENNNYKIFYLDLKNAKPQDFTIKLTEGKRIINVPYSIKEKRHYDGNTFDSSDVVYLLMPDRFANGNKDNDVVEGMREMVCDSNIPMARHGGDLMGMTDKLDYLAKLGITAIWPTPLLENNMEEESYHGYAITNYYNIDPRYGTNEDYKNYVEQAHKKGIKIIKDLVFNHCGSFNTLFTDLPQKDWFNFDSHYVQSAYRTAAVGDPAASKYDKTLTTDGWFVKTMPDWNQKNRLVKDYLIQASIWWIEFAGIDGIRQDTYPYCDFNAMVEWCDRIEEEFPGFNIVGEAWINNNVGVAYWQKDSKIAAPLNSKLRTVMDFPLMALLNYVCDQNTDDWDNGFARIYDYIGQDMVFEDTNHLLTFLDNHDTDRFQKNNLMANDTIRYKQALALLLTLRGIPQLYYGNEVGMAANKAKGDGALRQNFPGGWSEDKANAFTMDGRSQLQDWYYNYTSSLLNWRKNAEAVHYGKTVQFHVRNGVYVFARVYGKKVVTVFINGTKEQKTVDLTPFKEVLPASNAFEVVKNKNMIIGENIIIQPKDVLILDFN